MKLRIIKIAIVVLIISGIGLFLYPPATGLISNYNMGSKIKEFERVSDAVASEGSNESGYTPKISERLYADMTAFNVNLYENGQASLTDPFSYERSGFDLTKYGLEDNMVGYITVPKMEVELPIYLGESRENLAKGAACLGQTSLPIGGENCNTVLAGHRGYRGTAMFRNIEALESGDKVYIKNFWTTLIYEVVEIKIIPPSDIDSVLIQSGRDLVTLITCHPYTKNYNRYVVYCERTDETTNEATDEIGTENTGLEFISIFYFNELSESQQLIYLEHWAPIAVATIIMILLMIRLVLWRVRKKKKES